MVAAAGSAMSATKAFPGAEGFGAYAAGGRGGAVYLITTVNNSGKGSLRECAEATGPRTCVIRIAGTIDLLKPIWITNPFITIVGQTAPGGGLALRVAAKASDKRTPLIVKNTHDVVIRHIRSRPGSAQTLSTSALLIENSRNVIIDHVSMSWATDQNFSAYSASQNVTLQWSIVSEGLMQHSKGSLTCDAGTNCFNFTFHHNLYAHNRDRNPDLKLSPAGHVDFIDNVVFNPQSAFAELWTTWGGLRVNLIGNSFLKGPETSKNAYAVRYTEIGGTGNPVIYMLDNVAQVTMASPNVATFVSNIPAGPISVPVDASILAKTAVIAKAGAWPRDAVDKRVVNDVIIAKGKHITSPTEVGGYPALSGKDSLKDIDSDGMPDDWELANHLNPNMSADRNNDQDADGFTELEEYLDARARQITPL